MKSWGIKQFRAKVSRLIFPDEDEDEDVDDEVIVILIISDNMHYHDKILVIMC